MSPADAQDWLAGSSPRVRAICADLRARLFAFKPGVSERIRRQYCVFLRNSYPFAYAFPQGVRLRLLLNLKRGELDASDGIAQCIVGSSHEGQGDWLVSIADGRDLERAMPLIRQAFNAAESRGRT